MRANSTIRNFLLWFVVLVSAIGIWALLHAVYGAGPCDLRMPCSMTREDALRQAYQYCMEYFYIPPGQYCDTTTCDATIHSESYSFPPCIKRVQEWQSTPWKKHDDAADALQKQRAIDHAKAFIEAVPP